MPGSNSDANQSVSPLEIVTSTKPKKGVKRIVAAVIIIIFLVVSVVAGVLLVGQNQNIQEKAKVTICPGAEACPYPKNRNLLLSCHPVDSDGTTTDSLCSWVGRVETCGSASTKYCCPAAGGFWTTDMTACTSPPVTYSCSGIGAYDTNVAGRKTVDLSKAKPGTIIYFTVKGSAATGFVGAKFKIKGVETAEITSINFNGEFYYEYTVPAQCTVSTGVPVQAKIHYQSGGADVWSTY